MKNNVMDLRKYELIEGIQKLIGRILLWFFKNFFS